MNILNISICVVIVAILIIYLKVYNDAIGENDLNQLDNWVIENNLIIHLVLIILFSILAYINKSSMNILILALICILVVILKFIIFYIYILQVSSTGETVVYILTGINSVLLLSVMYILFISL